MVNLRDGLGGEEVITSSGANLYTQNPYITGSLTTVGNIKSFGNIISDSRILSSVGTGSPTTWGLVIQAGSAATGAGSSAWVKFGTAFSLTPCAVLVDEIETAGEWAFAPVGSWNAGSFYVETQSASKKISWIAVGTI